MIFPLVLIGKGFFIALNSPVMRFMAVLGLGGVFAYGRARTAKKGLCMGWFLKWAFMVLHGVVYHSRTARKSLFYTVKIPLYCSEKSFFIRRCPLVLYANQSMLDNQNKQMIAFYYLSYKV